MSHNNEPGIFGWACTTFLFLVNAITPQDWSYIMAGIAAGATAVYYIGKTINLFRDKNEKRD